ncbi:hypothetical protein B0H14DRAFT_3427460 [Mycena olivaceomarginata]|nr:hypothetical protein B0H14DRAFT_3427460 [Mycena olivaceomarginata]
MSSNGQTIFNDSKALYCYVAITGLFIIILISSMLFWLSCVIEAHMRLVRPAIPLSTRADLERKLPLQPRPHEAYLEQGAGAGAEARHEARLSRRACQNGLPRLVEFEFGCVGLDGLAWGWA